MEEWNKDGRASDDAGSARRRCLSARTEGAKPSNTAPSTYISPDTDGFQYLGSGIDSLYLSYRGNLRPGVEESLLEAKTVAQVARQCGSDVGSRLSLGGRHFEVSPSGARGFAYVFQDGHFQVKIAPSPSRGRPVAHVQVRSVLAQFSCPLDIDATLRALLADLIDIAAQAEISRLDLNTDFCAEVDPSDWAPDAWVTRAEHLAVHLQKHQLSGLLIGRGGQIMARVYDKTLEISHSGHDHIQERWRYHGWDGARVVWRLEFQLRREALRQLDVLTVDDLPGALGPVWGYCTRNWLRLACPSAGDSNRSRWPTHPLWERLRAVPVWDVDNQAQRCASPQRIPSDAYFAIHGLGPLTSLMARDGLLDPHRAAVRLIETAHRFHADQASGSSRGLSEYLRQKVATKRIKYNLPPCQTR
jgi:hypothetical protein